MIRADKVGALRTPPDPFVLRLVTVVQAQRQRAGGRMGRWGERGKGWVALGGGGGDSPRSLSRFILLRNWSAVDALSQWHEGTGMAENTAPSKAVAVDLFCGAGGLSYGMQKAGIKIDAGIDVDPACRYPYESNVGATFLERDVTKVTPDFVASLFSSPAVRVIAGCAPCQPYSTYAAKRSSEDDEWKLLPKFAEIVSNVLPEVVTMENVPRLQDRSIFKDFLTALDEAGYGCSYGCSYGVVRCADYGVPQTRQRLVLLASRLGRIDLEAATHNEDEYVTVGDAIRNLESIEAGATSDSDPLHRASGLSETNLRRIQNSEPGGTWRDWDADLRAACHIRTSGETYPGVYGRMDWDRLAPTITTQFNGYGNGRFGHPAQDRAVSLREGAILQTFPADYAFVPEGADAPIAPLARLIGNAVPVKLGEAIGRSIVSHIEQHSDS